MSKKKAHKNYYLPIVKWGWLLLVTGLVLIMALFVLVSFTKMPDTEELENPDYEQASIIYADDLSELGRYYSKNRVLLTFDELNPYLINALIATEDERFFSHSGIDAKGTARAILFFGNRGGASTITQQLAKQFFTKRSRSFVRRVWQKMKEWVIAVEFEKRYTKEEIIAMYLNKFEFIYSSFGVSSAARTYFGKDQKELSLDEAAILIGMLKNPYTYNPRKHPENALKRRNVVLRQMVKNKFITNDEYELIKEKPIDVSNFKRTIHYEGPAPYFRSTLTTYLKNLFQQKKYLKPDGTPYDIYEDGLKFFTTINKKMQHHAESVAIEHMNGIQQKYFSRWKNKDPWTFRADEKQKAIRKTAFNKLVRDSERYQSMRHQLLGESINEINELVPEARLWESDISRLLQEEKEPGYLSKLRRKEIISTKQMKIYAEILKTGAWKKLKKERRLLDEKAMTVFNKKREMKVFSFSENMEKTVTMSPLDSIRYHEQHLQIGSVAIEPSSGHVKNLGWWCRKQIFLSMITYYPIDR